MNAILIGILLLFVTGAGLVRELQQWTRAGGAGRLEVDLLSTLRHAQEHEAALSQAIGRRTVDSLMARGVAH